MWNLALRLTRQSFRCADNKTCVPEFIVCDGIAHCEDGSDEGEVLLGVQFLQSAKPLVYN